MEVDYICGRLLLPTLIVKQNILCRRSRSHYSCGNYGRISVSLEQDHQEQNSCYDANDPVQDLYIFRSNAGVFVEGIKAQRGHKKQKDLDKTSAVIPVFGSYFYLH